MESWALYKATHFTQLCYDNIKDKIFTQKVTLRKKNKLSEGNTLSEISVLIREKPVRSGAIHCASDMRKLSMRFKISEMRIYFSDLV